MDVIGFIIKTGKTPHFVKATFVKITFSFVVGTSDQQFLYHAKKK